MSDPQKFLDMLKNNSNTRFNVYLNYFRMQGCPSANGKKCISWSSQFSIHLKERRFQIKKSRKKYENHLRAALKGQFQVVTIYDSTNLQNFRLSALKISKLSQENKKPKVHRRILQSFNAVSPKSFKTNTRNSSTK